MEKWPDDPTERVDIQPRLMKGGEPRKNFELTDLQKRDFDALHTHPDRSFKAQADELGTDRSTVFQRYKRVCMLLGLKPTPRTSKKNPDPEPDPCVPLSSALTPSEPVQKAADVRKELLLPDLREDPDAMNGALLALSDPQLETLAAAAKAAGIRGVSLRRLLSEVEARPRSIVGELKEIRTDYLAKMAGTAAAEIISRVDVADIEAANLRDKVLSFAILTDKKLLLEGKPTQRIAVDDIPHLGDLVMKFLQEAPRRGMEVNVSEGKVTIDQVEVFESTHGRPDKRVPTQTTTDAEWEEA